jgi:ribosomal protein S4E
VVSNDPRKRVDCVGFFDVVGLDFCNLVLRIIKNEMIRFDLLWLVFRE